MQTRSKTAQTPTQKYLPLNSTVLFTLSLGIIILYSPSYFSFNFGFSDIDRPWGHMTLFSEVFFKRTKSRLGRNRKAKIAYLFVNSPILILHLT